MRKKTIALTSKQARTLVDCVALAINQFEANDELEELKNIVEEATK